MKSRHPQIAQLMGDIPCLSLDELTAHPRLAHARQVFLREILKLYGDPLMVRLLVESARYMVFTFSIINYASQDPGRPESWATVGRLKQAMQGFGDVSDRQIDILITRLRDRGFVEIVHSERDARKRIVKPTELALAHDRAWLAAHYAPLAALYPERNYTLATSRNAAFQVRQRCRAMEFAPLVRDMLMPPPEVMVFFSRPGGYMFLAALLQATKENPGSAHVSYADLGRRFGYSRAHVRKVLTDAETVGLVRLRGRGGHDVEILPVLQDGHDKGVAIGMCLHDMVHARVMADWPKNF